MAKRASKARGGRCALYVSVLVALGVLSPFAMGLAGSGASRAGGPLFR
jgi:hypothetical protein